MSNTAITEAAHLLRDNAEELKNSHTIGGIGEWDACEAEVKAVYDNHIRVADALDAIPSQCLTQLTEPAPLSDYQEGQWWVQELDKITSTQVNSHLVATPDLMRAVAVVHSLLRQIAAPATARNQGAPLPLLVRDIARELGITSVEACIALKPLGDFSTNMAVTSEMMAKLRECFPAQVAAGTPVVAPIETELYRAAISCHHAIDRDKVVLYFDEKQPGHNALNQLGRRLDAAHAAILTQAAPVSMERATPEWATLNEWFLSLPEGRQAILRDDKWMLANAAFEAGQSSAALAATPAAVQTHAEAAAALGINSALTRIRAGKHAEAIAPLEHALQSLAATPAAAIGNPISKQNQQVSEPMVLPEPVATIYTMEALAPGGAVKYHTQVHKALPSGTKLLAEPDVCALLAQAVEVDDHMALAFHHAITDGAIGQDELNEIKTGLRAVLVNLHAPQARDAEITWPKARDVGRIGDMSQVAHIRVGFDSDNDVFVSVWDENGGGSIEFCNPGGGGGGKSSRTRLALLALMVAMEADNADDPGRDWWARRDTKAAKE